MKVSTFALRIWLFAGAALALFGQAGPPGGVISDLHVADPEAGLIYVAADSGLYRSQDAGASWTSMSNGLPLFNITAVGGPPEQLYVGVDDPDPELGGVYLSRDGEAFTRVSEGLGDTQVFDLAVDPNNPDIVIASTAGAGVFYSNNAGAGWIRPGTGLADTAYNDVAFAPGDSQHLFAASVADADGIARIYESVDGAQTWSEQVAAAGGIFFRRISFDPQDPGIVYVTSNQGLVRRPAANADFELAPNSQPISFIEVAVDAAQSDILYAATRAPFQFLRSEDRGTSWTPTGGGLPQTILSTVNVLPDGRVLAGAAGTGVFTSVDRGERWTLSARGLNASDVRAVAVNPSAPDEVLAAVEGGGLFQSVRQGDDWAEARQGYFGRRPTELAFDPSNRDVAYVSSVNPVNPDAGALYRTLDGGASWENIATGSPIFAVATHPTDGRTVWIGSDGGSIFFPQTGLFLSRNQGLGATPVSGDDGILFGYDIRAIAVDPQNPRNVYVAGSNGFNSVFFWSDDEGDEFRGSLGLATTIESILIDPNQPRRIWITTSNGGLLRSDDAGRSFAISNGGLPEPASFVFSVEVDPEDGSALYASTSGGVYKSADGGATWAFRGAGLETVAVRSIEDAPGRSGILFAASNGAGVWRSTDAGATWQPTGGSIVLTPDGIVAAFDFSGGGVAPGQIVQIFGADIGPAEAVEPGIDPATGKLFVGAAGVQVFFDDTPAPLFYLSNGQINCQVPYEVAGRASVRVRVVVNGASSARVVVPVRAARPSVYATPLNQNSTLNSAENPAAPGEIIQLFATGQGVTTPAVMTGALAPGSPPFAEPDLEVIVRIDGREATVVFAGLTPGLVGVLQINVTIPPGIGDGPREIEVEIGGAEAAQPAQVFVERP